MTPIEVLKTAFEKVCSKAECQAIIDAPKIACGVNASMFEKPGDPKSPETIIADRRDGYFIRDEWRVFDDLCDAVESEGFLYLDALEAATESDVREAARLAMEGKK